MYYVLCIMIMIMYYALLYYDYQIKIKKSVIKIPQVFFWKFYSRGKFTCTKTFRFVTSTKECICNTQFYGLVTPAVQSCALSLKNPKLREQLFSVKKAVPLMKVLLILKLVREKWLIFQKWQNFSQTFFSLIRYVKSLLTNIQKQKNKIKISLLFKKFTNFRG